MGKKVNFFKGYFASLIDPTLVPTALKVAVVVGSILFMINHGHALLTGKMGRDRWISAMLTYVVPYFVNIHGQYISIYRNKSF
ncbi:nitrate/nitrite transporter NrtS [Anabaena azotica]|uniref:Nitrate/nitrite transporter NrtS n=1 Tax=Anabaena azotica FACHB-119 TaxID=947527 RepID=A0ABR8D1F8_9NOST|nr:nitrate/nitrite transporter NrtS [Anabaena azotica]MBD2501025.1 nitrate/nitrite transporter NrtS [Anabaena azotica FACHB-119]